MTPPEIVARRILIVDDEAGVRHALHRLLTAAGYDVQEATDGAAALEAYARQPSDVVITDVLMPGKEGLETIRELRRRDAHVRLQCLLAATSGADVMIIYKWPNFWERVRFSRSHFHATPC